MQSHRIMLDAGKRKCVLFKHAGRYTFTYRLEQRDRLQPTLSRREFGSLTFTDYYALALRQSWQTVTFEHVFFCEQASMEYDCAVEGYLDSLRLTTDAQSMLRGYITPLAFRKLCDLFHEYVEVCHDFRD